MGDVARCEVCGWPLGTERGNCRPGDCSMRPRPNTTYADMLRMPQKPTYKQLEARLATADKLLRYPDEMRFNGTSGRWSFRGVVYDSFEAALDVAGESEFKKGNE
jgi:hypothetical protein